MKVFFAKSFAFAALAAICAAAAVIPTMAATALTIMPNGEGISAGVPKVRFVPQPALKITGFWADRLDRLERVWIPHCWNRLGVKGVFAQRNLAEATMLALERHPERKDLSDILERFVRDDISRQQKDGYAGHCNTHYVDFGQHEFYVQGYYMEAAVRHMSFTKGRDRRYFDAAIRLADHLDSVFGPPLQAYSATLRFELPLPLQRVTCDARVAANRGLVAWQQGPIVYAWEGKDFKQRVPY